MLKRSLVSASARVNWVRLCILLLGSILLISACNQTSLDSSAQPSVTSTLIDPHHHVVDVSSNSLGPQNAPEFQIMKIQLEPEFVRENSTTNQAGILRAFSACNQSCGIFFENLKTRDAYQMKAPSFLPGRPFQDLAWVSDEILVFDQWTQPHYGVHYAVNVREGKLLLASPFPDRLP